MCLCVYVRPCVCVHVCVYVRVCVDVCVSVRVHTRVSVYFVTTHPTPRQILTTGTGTGRRGLPCVCAPRPHYSTGDVPLSRTR